MHAGLIFAGFYFKSDIDAIEAIDRNDRHGKVYNFFFGKLITGIQVNFVRYIGFCNSFRFSVLWLLKVYYTSIMIGITEIGQFSEKYFSPLGRYHAK
jgi:hypothetical protein